MSVVGCPTAAATTAAAAVLAPPGHSAAVLVALVKWGRAWWGRRGRIQRPAARLPAVDAW